MPPRAAVLILIVAGVLSAAPAAAQDAWSPTRVVQVSVDEPQPDPPGPYVIDVRGVISGLPQSAGFFPTLPADTVVPSRGLGFDLGAHVYIFTLGRSRVGVGANVIRVLGRTASAAATLPAVERTFTALTPQISFNFGTEDGWSYLSAGYGTGQVETSAEPPTGPELTRDSGRVGSINYGGGARWFLAARMAFGFDVRFHRLSAGSATPGATLVAASVGLSLR